jgi:hypothetical protein
MKRIKEISKYLVARGGAIAKTVAKVATYALCVWIAVALVRKHAVLPFCSFTPTTVEVPIWVPAKGKLLNEPGPVVFGWTETSARNVIGLTRSEAFDAVAKKADEVEVVVLREGHSTSKVVVRWFAYIGETTYRLYEEVVPPEPGGSHGGSFTFSKPAITGDKKISWTSLDSEGKGVAVALFYLMGVAGGMFCGLALTKASEYLWDILTEDTSLPPSPYE